MKNQNIKIIGGGLFFTEIEVETSIEEHGASESDKEAIKRNIEEVERLKAKKGKE